MTKPRRDGRQATTAGFVQQLLRQPPQLAFDPARPLTPWRNRVRAKLRQLLRFPQVPPQPSPKLIADRPREGYRYQSWELYPEPGSVVPFAMLVPDHASAQMPAAAVMCFPGSEQPKEALCGEPWTAPWQNRWGEHNFMAKHFVQAGMVAVALDNPGTCELSDPDLGSWRRQSEHLIWLGRTYEALSVFHRLQALTWLKTLPFVDRRRIAACGHSLGAKPALLLGLLDRQLAAVIWNDHASNWRREIVATKMQPVAPWHYIPEFACWFDYVDLMCALAPTPFLITEGGVLADHARIRQAYALAGAGRQLTISFMPNFRDPQRRCRRKLREGLDAEAYRVYANFDGDHYFKDDVAVPWLAKMIGAAG